MSRTRRVLGSVLASVLLASGCTGAPAVKPRLLGTPVPAYTSIIPTGTFLCAGGAFVPPVAGRLAGDSADPRLVWLISPSGGRIDVAWPPGFGITFEPTLKLIDDTGAAIAAEGERIEINIDDSSHAGTAADPYPAMHFNGHCFAPVASP